MRELAWQRMAVRTQVSCRMGMENGTDMSNYCPFLLLWEHLLGSHMLQAMIMYTLHCSSGCFIMKKPELYLASSFSCCHWRILLFTVVETQLKHDKL